MIDTVNEMNKAADQECSLARPLVGNAVTPPQPVGRQVMAHSTFLGRGPRRSAASIQQGVRLTALGSTLRPSLLCAGAAGSGCHGDGALPARAPPPGTRLRAPRQVRAGRCGAAGHCGRCAEGAGARGRARGRAETRGTPTPARGAAWKVGKVGGRQSGDRGARRAECHCRLGDPVASAAGE